MTALASRVPDFREPASSYFRRKRARIEPEVNELWEWLLVPIFLGDG